MNLIIDIGNSFVKLAVFHRNKIEYRVVCDIMDLFKSVKALKSEYPFLNRAIVSSVVKLKEIDIDLLAKNFNLLSLSSTTPLPFTNLYKSRNTLGLDRLALVSASILHYSNKNVLVVDAGTCITFDFKNTNNEYLGGAISPGIQMRYKALNFYTANLPLLELQIPQNYIGSSTDDSIHSGVIHGVLNEIDGVINAYKLKYPNLTVILTGGDAKFLSKQLKSSIFANPNFLLEGLNLILEFNSNE